MKIDSTRIQPVEILLVEDNEDDIILIKEAIEDARMINIFQVARDGEEALASLRREGRFAGAKQPDLVLLDINMPKKNGLEVLAEMKADAGLAHIPVVMLTTSEREVDVVRSYSNGACSFVRKPVEFGEFKSALNKFSIYWAMVVRLPKHS